MDKGETIRIPQDRETGVTTVLGSDHAYRYAYSRSDDSRRLDDIGQDYLVIRTSDTRFAFALCDGVSQSFLGDLAATILAEALVNWLWEADSGVEDPSTLVQRCRAMLGDLTSAATEQVRQTELPSDLPGMLRDVLEQKRLLGSESTFVAGRIGPDTSPAIFVWMGDSRLRIWLREQRAPVDFGDVFHTRERWSTNKGPVGDIRSYSISSDAIVRMVAYSDGLAWADQQLTASLKDDGLKHIIAESRALPSSDDVSYLEYGRRQRDPEVTQELESRHVMTPDACETDVNPACEPMVWKSEPASVNVEATTSAPAGLNQTTQRRPGPRVETVIDFSHQQQGSAPTRPRPKTWAAVTIFVLAVAVIVLALI